MTKFSLFLVFGSIFFVGIGGWKLNQIISLHESNTVLISSQRVEVERIQLAMKDYTAEHAVRFARERTKNQEMEEQLATVMTEKSVLEESIKQKSESLESIILSNDTNKERVIKLRVDLLSSEKKLDLFRERVSQISQGLPFIERNILMLEDRCAEQKNRSLEVSRSLINYGKITEVLKKHFSRTLDSIHEEKYDRPWIEKGEFIELSDFSLNLEEGLMGLPVGREIGIEKDAFFSIRFSGELICKIKIKQSSQKNSIGAIMPLIGNPKKLLLLNRFALTHL